MTWDVWLRMAGSIFLCLVVLKTFIVAKVGPERALLQVSGVLLFVLVVCLFGFVWTVPL